MRSIALASLFAVAACFNPVDHANSVLGDPGIQRAVSAIAQSNDGSLAYCRNIPSSVAGWTPLKKDIRFNTDHCTCAASSDSSLVGEPCEVSLSLIIDTGAADGEFKQLNEGGVSTGSGEVSAFAVSPEGVHLIAQTNHAEGAGCTQENLNVIVFGADSYTDFCTVTYTKTSTCGHQDSWKVSVGTYFGYSGNGVQGQD